METATRRECIDGTGEKSWRCGRNWEGCDSHRFITVGINWMEEDMARYQKMEGETLAHVIKRGILIEAPANESEQQKRIFRNASRLTSYHNMREDADKECFCCRNRGHKRAPQGVACGREKAPGQRDQGPKDKKKNKRHGQKERQREAALEIPGPGTGVVGGLRHLDHPHVGTPQARMVFALEAHDKTAISNDGSCKQCCEDSSGLMRVSPLQNAITLDSGAQGVRCRVDKLNAAFCQRLPSSVT